MIWEIGTPNDPFCGHLRVDEVMEPFAKVKMLEKVWYPQTRVFNGTWTLRHTCLLIVDDDV